MIKAAVLVKFYKGELNPFDAAALECALRLDNLDITLVSMSPISNKQRLAALTRLGCKAILLSDNVYAGSDTLATSKVLSTALKRLSPDIVICGRQSVDGDTAQVPAQVAAMLNFNLITNAMELNLERVSTRLGQKEIELPCVISMEKVADLRFASIRSKPSDVEVLDNNILNIPKAQCGLSGSPTKVVKVFENQRGKRKCRFASASDFEKELYKAKKQTLLPIQTNQSGKKLKEVHIVGGELLKKAEEIAEKVTVIPHGTREFITDKIKRLNAKFVLFAADLNYRAIAPQIAADLDCGLCADCTNLETDGNELFMYRPAGGGNITAKIKCVSPITMATVRLNEKGGGLVFGIGSGAVKYAEYIKTLAQKYGAEIAGSRKAVDGGCLDYECQVGLTGRIITPEVYVAFGISGEIHHIVGMDQSQTVIAINNDKNAKIFDFADIGIVDDVYNLQQLI